MEREAYTRGLVVPASTEKKKWGALEKIKTTEEPWNALRRALGLFLTCNTRASEFLQGREGGMGRGRRKESKL